MNADQLLDLYDRVAESPDAIPRLRRFVLDLAVRGKLVEQDEADEPILSYLTSNAELDAKARKSLKALPSDDCGGPLPESWVWLSLGSIIRGMDAGWSPQCESFPREKDDEWAVLRTTAVQQLRFDSSENKRLPAKLSPRPQFEAEVGDILITRAGPKNRVGVSCVVDVPCPRLMISDKLIRFHAIGAISARYVALTLNAGFSLEQIEAAKSGMAVMQMNISQDKLRLVPVPLPPLAEQHRIVAKVDELMALLDRLEQARAGREALRDQLTAATLNRLTQTEPHDFQPAAHFALQTLPHVTTRPNQIKTLRQTILNLAVRGKLVEQDAADEPASKLLKVIELDKARRAISARDRRATRIEPLSDLDAPYLAPSSWVWAAFGDVVISRDGERVPVSSEERNGRSKVYDYYGASGVIDKIDGYLFDKPLLLIGEDGANLINRSTPIAFIAKGKYWVNNHAHVLDGFSEGFLRYIEIFINATDLKPYVTGTAQPKMNQAKMNSIPVALPPLAEQHRIVARVDALMALCDQLEAGLAGAEATRSRLLDALLHAALSEPEAA